MDRRSIFQKLNPFDRTETIETHARAGWVQRVFDRGYTPGEIDRIQNEWQLQFPPDLIELYGRQRYLAGYDLDWLKWERQWIRNLLDWPLEGLWFDVQNNDYWWPEWGEKPLDEKDRRTVLEEVVSGAPVLIPVGGHRYLPSEPVEAGNPVFSIWQSDVINYGSDLNDWISREKEQRDDHPPVTKEIRFWSDVVALNE